MAEWHDPTRRISLVGETGVPAIEDADVAAAFSSLGGEDEVRPCLRSDLQTKAGPPGQILVCGPESPRWFPLHDFEWRIAQLFDGKRDFADISTDVRHIGIAANPDMVRAFARELMNYGFLDQQAARRLEAHAAPPGVADMSPEARQLFNSAQAMQAKGDLKAAADYLSAILEVTPDNRVVRGLLTRLQQEMSPRQRLTAPPPGPILLPDTDTAPATGAAARPWRLVGGVLVVVVVGLLGLWLGRQRPLPALPALPGTPATATTPSPSPPPAAPAAAPVAAAGTARRFAFTVVLQAGGRVVLEAKAAGIVSRVRAPVGDMVATDGPIIDLADKALFKKLLKVRKDRERHARLAANDTMERLMLGEIQQKLNALEAKATVVKAPAAGRVAVLHQALGDAVRRGDPLVTLEDASVLAAKVPITSLPSGWRSADCRIERPGALPLPCAAVAGGAEGMASFQLDNAAGRIKPGSSANLELLVP